MVRREPLTLTLPTRAALTGPSASQHGRKKNENIQNQDKSPAAPVTSTSGALGALSDAAVT